MKRYLSLALFLLTITILINSCGKTPYRVDTLWEDDRYKETGFHTILVIGITEDEFQRKGFEIHMKNQLEKSDVKVIESLKVLQKDVKLTKENFDEHFKDYHIDGIITVRVVSKDIKRTDAYNINYNNPTGFYGFYYNSYDFNYSSYMLREKVIKIEANLFEATNGDLVWSGLSQTTDYTRSSEVILPLTKEIAEVLTDLGYLD